MSDWQCKPIWQHGMKNIQLNKLGHIIIKRLHKVRALFQSDFKNMSFSNGGLFVHNTNAHIRLWVLELIYDIFECIQCILFFCLFYTKSANQCPLISSVVWPYGSVSHLWLSQRGWYSFIAWTTESQGALNLMSHCAIWRSCIRSVCPQLRLHQCKWIKKKSK